MKIDFNKDKSMAINLDKVPRLLYINEDGHSCGQLYFNGVRIKPLKDVDILAKTDDAHIQPLKFIAHYFDEKDQSEKTISMGDYNGNIRVTVKITDIEALNEILTLLKDMLLDADTPEKYQSRILEAFKKVK